MSYDPTATYKAQVVAETLCPLCGAAPGSPCNVDAEPRDAPTEWKTHVARYAACREQGSRPASRLRDEHAAVVRAIKLVSIAAMQIASNELYGVDDDGERRWSDEDSWTIKIGGSDLVTVTIYRCGRSFGETWHVPDVDTARFVDELDGFLNEVFK